MEKRDVFRIYKALSGIRKGIYWRNVDALDRIKDNVAINRFLRLFLEFQDESSSTTQIFVFVTVVFLTLLQLIPLYQIKINLYILLGFYGFILTLVALNHFIQKRKITKQLTSLEDEFSSRLALHDKELVLAGLKDDVIGYLSELKLMDEMQDIYKELLSKEKMSRDEVLTEIESIEEVRKDLLQAVNKHRLKIKEIKEASKSD